MNDDLLKEARDLILSQTTLMTEQQKALDEAQILIASQQSKLTDQQGQITCLLGHADTLIAELSAETAQTKAARRSANRLRVGILLMIFAFIGAQAWELLK